MNYRYGDPQHTVIIREADGAAIPVAAGNADYIAIVAEGAPIADWAPDMMHERDAAKRAIAAACEAARVRVAPYINYMDTEYQVLAAQADAYILAGSPSDPVGLDMLVQSAQDSGRSVAAEAALVRGKRDAYIALLNATRSLRRQGIAAIEAATDIEIIHSVRDQYVGQLASL